MELGLSLGEPSKGLNLLERGSERQLQKKSSFENGGRPNVCVALGLNTYSSENRGREKIQKKSQECEDHEDDGPNIISEEESRAIVNIIYYEKNPVQLDLLPQVPVIPRRIYLPWCSDNYFFKENGSSENMGLPAARGMNRPAEEASSANSVGPTFRLDSVGGKGDFEAVQDDALLPEGDSRASDGDEGGVRRRKKLRLSKQQSAFLEETFKDHHTLNPKQKLALAEQLNLRPRQVEVWFQNRRARTKLKQTEMDCEYLKRCCDTLRHENQRLQKELQELRALKISAPFCAQSPATTLTMCPSCERVAGGGAGKFSKTDVIPFALNRSKFFPFSQNSVRHPPQSAGGVQN